MEKKALFRVVRVRGLDIRAANILKQEMLSRGGEVATSREVYELHGESADCLVMGTLTQFERLLPKLKQQPFGLRRLAGAIETALRNYDERVPAGPPGLDLADAPLLMGVLNVTPDSFSDGGSYASAGEAVRAALDDGRGGRRPHRHRGRVDPSGFRPGTGGGRDRPRAPGRPSPGLLASRPDICRHLQGPGGRQSARGRRVHDQRRLRAAHGPGDGRRRPRRRVPGDTHAHAGRAQDHAGRARRTATSSRICTPSSPSGWSGR